MELKPNANIGTYHVLDGQRVTVRYAGQHQTCARCHQTARTCRGKGMARRCQEEGGLKADFGEYISNLWREIGYSPANGAAPDQSAIQEIEPEMLQQEGGKFTPKKGAASEQEKFAGISLKTFPKETDDCQIVELLVASGLPVTNMADVVIRPNGTVTVKNLENSICLGLIKTLHNSKHFDRRLFCNGIIPLTPEKGPEAPSAPPCPAVTTSPPSAAAESMSAVSYVISCTSTSSTSHGVSTATVTPTQTCSQPKCSPALSTAPTCTAPPVPGVENNFTSPSLPPNQSLLNIGGNTNMDIQQFIVDHQLVLNNSVMAPPADNLQLDKSARWSEAESVNPSTDDEELGENEDTENEGFKSMNDQKRGWKKKRKNSTTPSKEAFVKDKVKKLNQNSSPKDLANKHKQA